MSGTSNVFGLFLTLTPCAFSDTIRYRWEANVPPYDPSAGWIIADSCEGNCSDFVVGGRYRMDWPLPGEPVNYHLWIAQPGEPSPWSLWVEWRFRSNKPLGPYLTGCDARFHVDYRHIEDSAEMDGDAVVSFEGGDWVTGLALGEFHTYRFESRDGRNYCFWVDGINIWCAHGREADNDYDYLQFGGDGSCGSDYVPDMFNEWDYVRWGTIGETEVVTAAEPASGILAGREHGALERFAVTFDRPNYVYLEQISVDSVPLPGRAPVAAPRASAVLRRDSDVPETLQLVLDQPLPLDATTTVTIDVGDAVSVVSYTLCAGDANGDGVYGVADLPEIVACLQGPDAPVDLASCRFSDADGDNDVDLRDVALLQQEPG